MASDNVGKKTTPEGLKLCSATAVSVPVSPDRCIIKFCQSATKSKTPERLYTGETGRKRLRDVAELKDDVVNKRLKSIGSDFDFKYHTTYSCYKKYTVHGSFDL